MVSNHNQSLKARVQKPSQTQRIESEPVFEITQNIIFPRDLVTERYRAQSFVVNRYAELNRNG